jgi:hypothetical protein
MVETIVGETKRQAKERPKDEQPTWTKKKKKKLVPFVVGSYFTHGLSNVICMQIVRSNDNGKFKTCITCQLNFLSIIEVKACWKAMSTHCLKN